MTPRYGDRQPGPARAGVPTMLAAIMRAAMLTLTASRSAEAEAWSEAGNADPDGTPKLEALRQQAGKKARWASSTSNLTAASML
jgi:hypothetical protein